jgi:hypothetical protein
MRRPDSESPEPPGGRAAERLRDLLGRRFPGGRVPPPVDEETEGEPDADVSADTEAEEADKASSEE